MKFFEFLIAVVQALTTIIQDVFVFVGTMLLLAFLALWAVARLPSDHPLRRILCAFASRLAVTAGAAVVGIGAETIPGLDIVYNLAAPVGLLLLWASLLREVRAIHRESRRPAAITVRTIPNEPPANSDTEATVPAAPLHAVDPFP